MQISSLLHVGRGVTAIIGSGGKTTLMEQLAKELSKKGRVVLTTTTHIRRPARYPVLEGADESAAAAALAEKCTKGRLSAIHLLDVIADATS